MRKIYMNFFTISFYHDIYIPQEKFYLFCIKQMLQAGFEPAHEYSIFDYESNALTTQPSELDEPVNFAC